MSKDLVKRLQDHRRETLMHFIAIFLIVVGLLTLLKPMDH